MKMSGMRVNPREIGFDEMVEATTASAERHGGLDHIYGNMKRGEACRYLDDDGQPSCLVGHVLNDLGVQVDPAWDATSASVGEVLDSLNDFEFTRAATSFIEMVQAKQDNGVPWGKAIAQAYDVVSQEYPGD